MSKSVRVVVALGLLIGLPGILYWTRPDWIPWPSETLVIGDESPHDHAPSDRVKLTPQGRANLKLQVKPIVRSTYWRSLQVPGVIIDRPGISDRGVPAPVAGVIAHVHVYPGETVRPGDRLVTIRLVSELIQNTQSELYKTTQEVKLNQAQIARAKTLVQSGVLEESKVIELENQDRRLATQMMTLRHDLLARGLSPEQIAGVTEGRFVREIVLTTPPPEVDSPSLVGGDPSVAYEMQELKVALGEQVQAGQMVAVLANHRWLSIEGQGFRNEASLLERAAQNQWPIDVDFTDDRPGDWPPLNQTLTIRHLANRIDPSSRTFAFFIPLDNPSRSFQNKGQTFLVWRFRPGQRVRLHVPVEEFKNVIVLPVDAVARDGPEAYVFRQNGDVFDRKPVRIAFEDRRNIVLVDDGSLAPGTFIAQNAAAALDRVLRSQQAGDQGHDHAGHSH